MTPPTYTPLSRAGFEAIGIRRKRTQKPGDCVECWNERPVGCRGCEIRTGPDITGVLCNREPATTQEETAAVVEWLGKTAIWSPGCANCEGRPAIFTGCPCEFKTADTCLLHIRPMEPIDLLRVLGELAEKRNTRSISGLLITGGDAPLNPDHVVHLIEQAESAGVPVWLDWGVWMPRQEWENNPDIVLPDDYAVDRVRDDPDMVHIDADFGYHVMHRVKRGEFLMPGTLNNRTYRQLPASMGGV